MTRAHTHTHVHTHIHTHVYTHTRTHTYTRTCTHTRTHARTHTHASILNLSVHQLQQVDRDISTVVCSLSDLIFSLVPYLIQMKMTIIIIMNVIHVVINIYIAPDSVSQIIFSWCALHFNGHH